MTNGGAASGDSSNITFFKKRKLSIFSCVSVSKKFTGHPSRWQCTAVAVALPDYQLCEFSRATLPRDSPSYDDGLKKKNVKSSIMCHVTHYNGQIAKKLKVEVAAQAPVAPPSWHL